MAGQINNNLSSEDFGDFNHSNTAWFWGVWDNSSENGVQTGVDA